MQATGTSMNLTRQRRFGWRGWSLRLKVGAGLVAVGVIPLALTMLIAGFSPLQALPGVTSAMLLAVVLTRLLLAPIGHLKVMIERVQAGDLSARSGIDQRDEIGQIAAAFDALTERAQTLIAELDAQRLSLENEIIQLFVELSEAVNGNLTVRPTLSEGSLGAVADGVSSLLDRFSTIVRGIQETAREVSTGTLRMAETVQQVSREAHKQASALTRGAEGIGTLADSASAVSQRTQSAMTVSSRALDAVRNGHEAVLKVHETMETMRGLTRRAARQVKVLGESAHLMSQALALVQHNTEDLHIVAGNASIEAARYAESGGIFGAVADSIEALAEQSQLALRQVLEVAGRNQSETTAVVESIEDVTVQVATSVRAVRIAADAFSTVDGVVHELADLNAFIAGASADQAQQAHELTVMMGVLNGISVETSRGTAASAEAAVHLRSLTDQLNNSVSTLKVS